MTKTDLAAALPGRKSPGAVQVHLVGVSGGKDSAATYLRALERGLPFRAIMADVGNDHRITMEFAQSLPALTGGPPVEMVRADFSEQIRRKRENLPNLWRKLNIPEALIDEAVAALQPTGIPFLDLCLWKGRFPSSQARFCTEELKTKPLQEKFLAPILSGGQTAVSWQGVRADESKARALLKPLQELNHKHGSGRLLIWRPLLGWTVDDVWDIHRRHGVKPNPLYALGAKRVGCWPCVMGRKDELRLIAEHHPEEVDRIEAFERLVSKVARGGSATFYYVGRDPKGLMDIKHGAVITADTHGIRMMVDWSRTEAGGRQSDLFADQPSEKSIHYAESCGTEGTCE